MFLQLLRGRARDRACLRVALDRWRRELMPEAMDYLGTTAGFCDDGCALVLLRWVSPETAQINLAWPGPAAWWQELLSCFEDASVTEYDDVRPWLAGGGDQAGFVQVAEGRSPDVARLGDLVGQAAEELYEMRPEIIGGLFADSHVGDFLHVVYFTSEEEARRRERMTMPEGLHVLLYEQFKLMQRVTYYDLREPILISPH